jgi:alpha-acetolactate decarboxylase
MKKFIISEEEKNHIKKLYLIEGDEKCENEMYTVYDAKRLDDTLTSEQQITKQKLESIIKSKKPNKAISVQQFCNGKFSKSWSVSIENNKIEYERIVD